MDVITDHAEAPSGRQARLSLRTLTAAFLLSGVFCAIIAGIAYASLVAFALLEGVGIPATAFLGVALAVKTQQATLLLVTQWRPPVLGLVLAGLPAAAVAFGLGQFLRWGPWPTSGVLVVVGLVTQSLVLYVLVAAGKRPTSARLFGRP